MKYSIVYCSKTGNTKKLMNVVKENLKASDLIYCGAPHSGSEEADFIFVGFWTDKGTCSDEISNYLQALRGKKVFLFGTAGFGGGQEYFYQILFRVGENLSPDNNLVGTYMCTGRMPDLIRKKYELMMGENPARMEAMIDHFDKALQHPDMKDLNGLNQLVKYIMNQDKEHFNNN